MRKLNFERICCSVAFCALFFLLLFFASSCKTTKRINTKADVEIEQSTETQSSESVKKDTTGVKTDIQIEVSENITIDKISETHFEISEIFDEYGTLRQRKTKGTIIDTSNEKADSNLKADINIEEKSTSEESEKHNSETEKTNITDKTTIDTQKTIITVWWIYALISIIVAIFCLTFKNTKR